MLETQSPHTEVGALEYSDLRVTAGEAVLLAPTTASFAPGRVCVVLGPSGAGKTTLLRAIAHDSPTSSVVSGTTCFAGRAFGRAWARAYVCWVEADDHLCSHLTVDEHCVGRAAALDGVAYEAVLRCVALVGLGEEHHTKRIAQLSTGQRKRLHLALHLVGDAPVLLVDEPTSGLSDWDALSVCRALFDYCRRHRRVLLLSIHQPRHEIMDAIDDVLLVHGGHVLGPSSPNEMVSVLGAATSSPPAHALLDRCATIDATEFGVLVRRHTLPTGHSPRVPERRKTWPAPRVRCWPLARTMRHHAWRCAMAYRRTRYIEVTVVGGSLCVACTVTAALFRDNTEELALYNKIWWTWLCAANYLLFLFLGERSTATKHLFRHDLRTYRTNTLSVWLAEGAVDVLLHLFLSALVTLLVVAEYELVSGGEWFGLLFWMMEIWRTVQQVATQSRFSDQNTYALLNTLTIYLLLFNGVAIDPADLSPAWLPFFRLNPMFYVLDRIFAQEDPDFAPLVGWGYAQTLAALVGFALACRGLTLLQLLCSRR